ncbi:MAG TPA: hypothetical protein VIY86_11210, partial [Pirellulaceae bacterium]
MRFAIWISLSGAAAWGADPPGNAAISTEAAAASAPRGFYAAGQLQRVRRKDDGSERMALTDADGQITAFLAPTARLDFRQFLGREVAIKGRVLNLDDDNAPYVSVDQITGMYAGNQRGPRNRARSVAQVDFEEEIGPGMPVGAGPVIQDPSYGTDWQAVAGETIVDGQIMGPTMGNGQVMGPTIGNGQIMS